MTRDQKLEVHLESIMFEDQPEGTRLNAQQLKILMAMATPEQVERAYQRALVHCPLLLDDERQRTL